MSLRLDVLPAGGWFSCREEATSSPRMRSISGGWRPRSAAQGTLGRVGCSKLPSAQPSRCSQQEMMRRCRPLQRSALKSASDSSSGRVVHRTVWLRHSCGRRSTRDGAREALNWSSIVLRRSSRTASGSSIWRICSACSSGCSAVAAAGSVLWRCTRIVSEDAAWRASCRSGAACAKRSPSRFAHRRS